VENLVTIGPVDLEIIGLTEIILKKENKINRKKQQHNTLQTAVQQLGGMNKRTGRDLQNILRQSYDYITTVPMLRSTCDGGLICQTYYEECSAFLRQDFLVESQAHRRQCLAYGIPKRNLGILKITITSRSYDKLKIILL